MYNSKTMNVMKKVLLSMSAVAAMIAMTTTFSACSSDDEQQPSASMALNAVKGDYASLFTRAISLDNDGKLKTYWKTTDKVAVYKEGWTAKIGDLAPMADSEDNKTKLDGNVSSAGMSVGDKMELIMPRITWDYTGQDGTLETISSTYDYAIANAQINFFDQSNKIYASDAIFKTQQAIIKYTLVDSNGEPLNVTSLAIVSDGGKLLQSRNLDGSNAKYGGIEINVNTAKNVFYVAIRNEQEEADYYTLTVKSNGAIYSSKSPHAQTYSYGSYITHTVMLTAVDNTHTERDAYQSQLDVVW